MRHGYRWDLVICSLALLGLLGVVLAEPLQADGLFRRFIQRTRAPQPTGLVCEGGVCLPAPGVSYAPPLAFAKHEPVVVTQPTPVSAPTPVSYDLPVSFEEVKDNPFHREVVKAAVAAQRAGKISRIELMRLRVAMLAPAFRERAEDLALIQVAASGEEMPFEVNADGTINRASIDWQNLAAFLEKLVPLIIMLLKAFGI